MQKNNLTELVIKYRNTKKGKILEEIFKQLEKIIKIKAKYIFYVQTFNINNHEFKLVDTKKVELNDVIQELSLEIIEWINKCDFVKPFENYLYTCLWHWQPKFINADFIRNLDVQSIYKPIENDEGEEEINIVDEISTPEPINIEFFPKLTQKEQEVWELMQGDLNLSQQEIADELGVAQKTVSRIIARIREKLQK